MRREMVFGGATLALSAAYYWMADRLPASQLSDAIGPQGLPQIYSLALAALSLILIIGAASSRHRPAAAAEARAPLSRVAGVLLIGVAYIVLAPWIGYPVAIAAVIGVTAYYQGAALTREAALVAIAGGALFWLLFVVLMGIQQPAGAWR
jgi:putative tricarboxylic transport membrane protein